MTAKTKRVMLIKVQFKDYEEENAPMTTSKNECGGEPEDYPTLEELEGTRKIVEDTEAHARECRQPLSICLARALRKTYTIMEEEYQRKNGSGSKE